MGESISLSHTAEILHLNKDMDQSALRGRVNEKFLDQSLNALEGLDLIPRFVHWLTLARLTELALWCAGNYADNGWFTATGDLMFNPRRKFLARRNSSELIELDRHRPISEQTGSQEVDRQALLAKLKMEFRLVIEKKAIIPELFHQIQNHPIPSPPYLKQVESKMARISSTLSFQSTINLPRGMDLESYVRLLQPEQREAMEAQLCRFDLSMFYRFGAWIETNMGRPEVEFLGISTAAEKASQQAA